MKNKIYGLFLIFALLLSAILPSAVLPIKKTGTETLPSYAAATEFGQAFSTVLDCQDAPVRLLLSSDTAPDSYGAAVEASGYGGLYFYGYSSESIAAVAYDAYSLDAAVKWVVYDSFGGESSSDGDGMFYAFEGDVITEAATEGQTSFLSWGANAMGVPSYLSYLEKTYGTSSLNEVVVAVIDSGINTNHPLLKNRIADGGVSFASASDTPAYQDDNGHGSHVSGIIADLTLSNVKILPIKIINSDGFVSFSAIAAALTYVAELKAEGVNIVAANMSFSGPTELTSAFYAIYSSLINSLYAGGVVSVAAAGNNSADAVAYSPANIEKALTVSSVGLNSSGSYVIASNSNYGAMIDLAAPGVNIYSAYLGAAGYTTLSGTSMAAPHVTAAVALLRSLPSNSDMSSEEVEFCMKQVDAMDIGTATKYGYGLVHLSLAAPAASEQGAGSASEKNNGVLASVDESGESSTANDNDDNVIGGYLNDGSVPDAYDLDQARRKQIILIFVISVASVSLVGIVVSAILRRRKRL
ncbi:MAG: S8 family serine peptidase [Clostridiales bacterium]|jgi:subtilisin family serine protease|nr:S8 family serine peptidase [Clostridiales bacterium]